ncbi:FAD-binding oxidoreductase [uncultured Bartonella sp.]|uniref:FAD-binding oxidoreductase n=1 Tax=uncultured Bartonella sp. TaxID=104108 RepID=UPI00260AC549|nr:FAD-binding oxidoreductase [uncultured Bartonella sp.]
MDKKLIERFIAIVGINHALVDQDMIAPYLIEQRGLYHGRTALVLRPSSTQEVSQIMELAFATQTAIVPQGGNTGLVGAQQPDESANSIIVSMERLNRIRSIDVEGNLALVEAGVVLQNLQEKVDEKGLLFPLSLGSQGSCQIGGNLSSNAGGTGVLAYGNTRELCLGLEVVLPDGRILDDLRFVKKDNSGYDLKDLFIGAEGTLGIITAAVMKLFPKPQGKSVAYAGLKSPDKALKLLLVAQKKAGSMLTGFEIMAKAGMQMTLDYMHGVRAPLESEHEWYVLIELSSSHSDGEAANVMEDVLGEALENGIIDDAAIAQSLGQQKQFWQLREDMSPAQKIAGGSIKHDISVPIASIPDFIGEAENIINSIAPGARIVCFGHMGDGNLHYNVSQPVGADTKSYLALWEEMNHRIHTLAMRYNGSFSAEHGIGQLKRKELVAFKSPVAMSLMRSIKQVFDPKNIMNPGKML